MKNEEIHTMNQQYHITPLPPQQQIVYTHEQPGQMVYAVSPGRVSTNGLQPFTGTPMMRPSSTMVDENGDQVQFYPAMSPRPSMGQPYAVASARPSFYAPQEHMGDARYAMGRGQNDASNPYSFIQHNGEATHQPTLRQQPFSAQDGAIIDLPGPVPPAPHLWSSMVAQPQRATQRPENTRPPAIASPAAPGTLSPTLQRLLQLQQVGSRRSSTSDHVGTEKLLAEAEAFFAATEDTERELVDALEAVRGTNKGTTLDNETQSATDGGGTSPQKRQADASGADLSGSFSCTSVGTSVGAGAVADEGTTPKAASSQDRVKQDLAFCTQMVETMEAAGISLRTLDATNRRIQQHFLVDTYHGNKQGFFQRLHRRVEGSASANASGSPESSRRPSTASTHVSAQEAAVQAREDAVCDRLLADILMQRHFVPPNGGDASGSDDLNDGNKADAGHVRSSTAHTELRMIRFPAGTGPESSPSGAQDEEVPLLLITVPARYVAAFEASKASEEDGVVPSASSTGADITALTTPARYTQMQLFEAISERLETMRRRVGALEQRRATELQEIEGRLRELDAYDPSTDELHGRRERVRREMGLFQGWMDHMATLRARLLAAEQELFQSVMESREIRRQLLRVLEQRLQEDVTNENEENPRVSDKPEEVRFSHADHASHRDSVASDQPGAERRSTQRPQLPRASTVFLSMLQRISEEQKAQQQVLNSPLTERESDADGTEAPSSTVLSPNDALRHTAPPTSTDAITTTELSTRPEVEAVAPEQRAGRRRGRDEMEADEVQETEGKSTATATATERPHAITHSPHNSSTVSVSASSGEDEDVYTDPLPFACADEEDDTRDTTTDPNQEEYSLRSGKLFRGVAAFVKSVVKRAVTFSDDDSSDDEDGVESMPTKRHRTE